MFIKKVLVSLLFSFLAKAEVEFTTVSLKDSSTVQIPADWYYDADNQFLENPDKTIRLCFQVSAYHSDSDLKEFIKKAWRNLHEKILEKNVSCKTFLPEDGWVLNKQCEYTSELDEEVTLSSKIRVFNKLAYILLLQAKPNSLRVHASAIFNIIQTWKPLNFKTERYLNKKPSVFSKTKIDNLNKFIINAMDKLKIPGCAIGIVQNDQLIYAKGYGVKNIYAIHSEVLPNTRFLIGSLTKPFSSLMIGKLIELGKVRWDTQLKNIIPNLVSKNTFLNPNLELWHTLCACSGLPRINFPILFFQKSFLQINNFLSIFNYIKPTALLGSSYQYSNEAVALGAYAASHLYSSKKNINDQYWETLSDLVLSPLNLRSTTFFKKKNKNLAQGHSENLLSKVVPLSFNTEAFFYNLLPTGGLWSNVLDLSTYLRLEIQKGKNYNKDVLFNEKQFLYRRKPLTFITEGRFYGLGLQIENYKGLDLIGHRGETLGFTAEMFFSPLHNFGLVLLVNKSQAYEFVLSVRQFFLDELFDQIQLAPFKLLFYSQNYSSKKKIQHNKLLHSITSDVELKPLEGSYHADGFGTFHLKLKASKKTSLFFYLGKSVSECTVVKENDHFLIYIQNAPFQDFHLRIYPNFIRVFYKENTLDFFKVPVSK